MNPTIENTVIVSRDRELAVARSVIIDGTEIAADGFIKRGVAIVKLGNGKWRPAVVGDNFVANEVRILMDEIQVEANVDQIGVGYVEGFLLKDAILDANPGLTESHFTAAAGFYEIETNEYRFK